MYQFSGKLKTFSIALIIFGVLGIAFSFYSGSQKTIEDAKHLIEASHNDGHGNSHGDPTTHNEEKADDSHDSKTEEHSTIEVHTTSADNEHELHVLHQLQNRPWSAFYVCLLYTSDAADE